MVENRIKLVQSCSYPCFIFQLTQHPLEVDLLDQQKEAEERLLVEREEKARDEDARYCNASLISASVVLLWCSNQQCITMALMVINASIVQQIVSASLKLGRRIVFLVGVYLELQLGQEG